MKKLIFLLTLFFFLSGCVKSIEIQEAVTIEDLVHYNCELEKCYIAHYYESNIPNNENRSFMIKTDSKEVHVISYKVTTGVSPLDIKLYEGATVSNEGTLVTSYNLNRNSVISSSTLIYYNPTITSYGNIIDRSLVTGTKTEAGNDNQIIHLILKPDTYYLLNVDNRANSNGEALFKFIWYEVDN